MYTCSLFRNHRIIQESNVSIILPSVAKNSQINVQLNFLWSITILVPVAGIALVFVTHRTTTNQLNVSDEDDSQSPVVVSQPEIVDSRPSALNSPPPVYPFKNETRATCEHDCTDFKCACDVNLSAHHLDWSESCMNPSPGSGLYQVPIVCMAGMGNMVLNKATIGSPATLARLEDRLLQLREHVNDPAERERLFHTSIRLSNRSQHDHPTFL